MLDPAKEIATLSSAIRDYGRGAISQADLRAVVDTIIERWRTAPESAKPPVQPGEAPLWYAVWEIELACREALAPDGVQVHLRYLSGELPLEGSATPMRP